MTANDPAGGDFEALARQYWNAWGDALRQGGQPQAQPAGDADPAAGWRQAVQWWTQLLPEGATPDAQDAVHRFREQAGDWFGTMQQVAARFAGRDSSSEEVAGAWREAVQGQGEHLLRWTLGAMRGGMPGGPDPWLQEAARLVERWQRDTAPWLDMPTFGLGRNHQARWQGLGRAQQDYQAHAQAYAEQLKAALERAFALFESKLAEHEELGRQLTSARAMFDLWIEAAEEAYAAVALSEEFRQVYGAFANAHMRLRAAVQQEVEQIGERLGMPTRSEMDAAHKRIAELERIVRRLAGDVARAQPSPPPERAAPAAAPTSHKPGAAAKKTKTTAATGATAKTASPAGSKVPTGSKTARSTGTKTPRARKPA